MHAVKNSVISQFIHFVLYFSFFVLDFIENEIVYASPVDQHEVPIQVRKLFIFTGEDVLIISDYQVPAIENFLF